MSQTDTHTRLIEAAINVFLEKGYENATIRDIIAQGQANVAAVNYHFGSKQALYAAVLENIMDTNDTRYPIDEGFETCSNPQERLFLFISNLLRMNFPEDEEDFRRGKLFWLEMGNPSPIFQPLVDRFMRPIKELLEKIIIDIIGQTDPETLRLCAGSVAGQCLFHSQSQRVIQQLYPDMIYTPERVSKLARHIYIFSLEGLKAIQESQGQPS